MCPSTPLAASAQSSIALNCGTPTPVIVLVVHTEPGPIPILTTSAPLMISSSVISGVTTLPAMITLSGYSSLTRLIKSTKFSWYAFATSTVINLMSGNDCKISCMYL